MARLFISTCAICQSCLHRVPLSTVSIAISFYDWREWQCAHAFTWHLDTLPVSVLTLCFCDWHEWQCVSKLFGATPLSLCLSTLCFYDWQKWQCVNGFTWNRDTSLVSVLTIWFCDWREWQCVWMYL